MWQITKRSSRIPEHFIIDDVLYGGVSNHRKSQWYKNVLANPDQVGVQLGFRRFPARIEFLDDQEFIEKIKRYTLQFPNLSAKAWSWDPQIGEYQVRRKNLNTVESARQSK